MVELSLDGTLCKKCGACVTICPASIFQQEGSGTTPSLVHTEVCISCGQCVAICSSDAIAHGDFPEGSTPLINESLTPSAEQTLQLITTRRSQRAFTKQKVAKEDIETIITAAHAAPTAHNVMSTDYVVLQTPASVAEVAQATASFLRTTYQQLTNPFIKAVMMVVAKKEITGVLPLLPDFKRHAQEVAQGEDTITHEAPVLMVFYGDPAINYANENAHLSAQNAALMAHALGLGTFYCGYVASGAKRDKALRKALGVPLGSAVFAVLAVGHPQRRHSKAILRKAPKVLWK